MARSDNGRISMNIETLLPHRAPMLMISSVISKGDSTIACQARIRAENPFLHDGVLPGFVCLELVAQAAGVYLGLDSGADEVPGSGAIVSVRDMILLPQTIQAGMLLDVSADFLGGNQQAAMFSGKVLYEGKLIFSTNVTVALFNEEGE